MGIIMKRREAKEFKKIAELVHEVWQVQKDNPKEDVGSIVYNGWSRDEDHVHVGSDIINITFREGGIEFYSDRWVNAKGERIIGIIGIIPGYKKVKFQFHYVKRNKKFEYTTSVAWANCHDDYPDYVTNRYIHNVMDQVLHHIISNFRYDHVAANLRTIKSIIIRKEFGLSLAHDSYYLKNKQPEYESVAVYHDLNGNEHTISS